MSIKGVQNYRSEHRGFHPSFRAADNRVLRVQVEDRRGKFRERVPGDMQAFKVGAGNKGVEEEADVELDEEGVLGRNGTAFEVRSS